jgi:hypothetical protein
MIFIQSHGSDWRWKDDSMFTSPNMQTKNLIPFTQFINTASGSTLPIGKGLDSCTSEVQESAQFELDGRLVTLIDTPGFDDSALSDVDVLEMIAAFLSARCARINIIDHDRSTHKSCIVTKEK